MKNTKVSGTHWIVENREGKSVLVIRTWSDRKEARHEAAIAGHSPTAPELADARAKVAKILLNS